MQTLSAGYSGMSLILNLNWDRILYVATIAAALGVGGLLGSLLS
ncbi:MAG: hypothetical protein ABNH26_14095 [Celeribacter sp.]|jgi:hypothetical protein